VLPLLVPLIAAAAPVLGGGIAGIEDFQQTTDSRDRRQHANEFPAGTGNGKRSRNGVESVRIHGDVPSYGTRAHGR
jgi:hypothetical protein